MQTRDQLLLLSQLAEPRGEEPEEFEFRVTPGALCDLFDRMALSLDEVLCCVREVPPAVAPE